MSSAGTFYGFGCKVDSGSQVPAELRGSSLLGAVSQMAMAWRGAGRRLVVSWVRLKDHLSAEAGRVA